VSSGWLIGFYFLVWTVYNLLIINFLIRFLRKKENIFLYQSFLANKGILYASFSIVQLYLFAPALVYAAFVASIAINLGLYSIVFSISAFLFLSVVLPVFIYRNAIAKPDIGLCASSFLTLHLRFKKPYFSFFFFHLLESEWLKLLVSKGLSALLLLGLVQILQTDNADIRPLMIVVLMGFLPNFTLIGSYHSFENVNLIWFRNLPFHLAKKWLTALATFAIVLLPELFLLYRYAWVALPWYVPLLGYFFGVGLLTLYYCGLYLKIAADERFSNLIFIAAIFCFLAILFSINVLLIIAVVLALGLVTFFKTYYGYEYLVKVE